MSDRALTLGLVTPPPTDTRRFEWKGGVFETARRPPTQEVEGRLCPSVPIVMATLRGGADHHEHVTDDGCRHAGADRPGTISFLPGGCGRRLRLRNVAWQWASLTLPASALQELPPRATVRSFSAERDDVVSGMLAELERLHAIDQHLDTTYCDAISLALVQYLSARYWRIDAAQPFSTDALPRWKLRRITEFVEANLSEPLWIGQLAALVGLSDGHFQRAFKQTTGQTPLTFITKRRLEAAKALLALSTHSVAEIAPRVGFVSQSQFTRTFKASVGVSPREYRQRYAAE